MKKNQHFVNQEYLRNFATPKSIAQHRNNPKKWHVHVYDKGLKRSLPSQPIRKVASERFFYNSQGEPEFLEDLFASVEGASSVIHEKLLMMKDHTKLSASERTTFAKFIAAQYVRTKQQRLLGAWVRDTQLVPLLLNPVLGKEYVFHLIQRRISEQHARIAQLEYESKLAHLLPTRERNEALKTLREQIEELNSQVHITKEDLDPAKLDEVRLGIAAVSQRDDQDHHRDHHVYQLMVFAPLLFEDVQNRVWRINENKTRKSLCTSDHPVLTIPITEPGYRDLNHGLLTLGLPDMGSAIKDPGSYPPFELVFPLSPKLALSFYPPGSNIESYQELVEGEVELLNEYQAIQSSTQVYSCDNNFAFVDSARTYYNQVRAYVESINHIQLPDAF